METLSLGAWGEARAARYLQAQGLRVVERNYLQTFGEVDLICKDRDTWVFVEVKTRSKHYEISALDAVHSRKRDRLVRAALSYMKWKRLLGSNMRFDIVTIEEGYIEWFQDVLDLPLRYTY